MLNISGFFMQIIFKEPDKINKNYLWDGVQVGWNELIIHKMSSSSFQRMTLVSLLKWSLFILQPCRQKEKCHKILFLRTWIQLIRTVNLVSALWENCFIFFQNLEFCLDLPLHGRGTFLTKWLKPIPLPLSSFQCTVDRLMSISGL